MTLVQLSATVDDWVVSLSRSMASRYRNDEAWGAILHWDTYRSVPREVAQTALCMLAEMAMTSHRTYGYVSVWDDVANPRLERAIADGLSDRYRQVGDIVIVVNPGNHLRLGGNEGAVVEFEFYLGDDRFLPHEPETADVNLSWLDASNLEVNHGWLTGPLFVNREDFLAAGGTERSFPDAAFRVDTQIPHNILDTTTGESMVMSGDQLKVAAWIAAGRMTLDDFVTRARERRTRTVMAMRVQARADEERAAQLAQERERAASRERLATFLDNARSTIDQDKEVIPLMPFVPHGLASSRRWGIEVESGGARGVDAPADWDRKSDGSLRSAWDGYVEREDFEPYDQEQRINRPWSDCENSDRHNPVTMIELEGRGWVPALREDYVPVDQCAGCGPMSVIVRVEPRTITHSRRGDDCAEFVSPILTSMHSRGLEYLTAELSKQPQNDTAGVHVHVEANDLTPTELNTLIYGYAMIEPLIEASYRRERRDYCASTPAGEVAEAARKAKTRLDTEVPYGERYRSVNMNSLSRHGTVEFRAMGPVYDYDHLIRWAMFCREMVNVVKGGATVSEFGRVAGSWDGLMKLFLKYGKEYTRAVVHERTGETGEWAKLDKRGNVTAGEIDRAIETDFAAWSNTLASHLIEAQNSLVRSLDDLQVAV